MFGRFLLSSLTLLHRKFDKLRMTHYLEFGWKANVFWRVESACPYKK